MLWDYTCDHGTLSCDWLLPCLGESEHVGKPASVPISASHAELEFISGFRLAPLVSSHPGEVVHLLDPTLLGSSNLHPSALHLKLGHLCQPEERPGEHGTWESGPWEGIWKEQGERRQPEKGVLMRKVCLAANALSPLSLLETRGHPCSVFPGVRKLAGLYTHSDSSYSWPEGCGAR